MNLGSSNLELNNSLSKNLLKSNFKILVKTDKKNTRNQNRLYNIKLLPLKAFVL